MASDSEEAPVVRAVLITLAVLALYVLSLGPAYRYAFDRATLSGLGTPNWVITAYYPLTLTSQHCVPVRKALSWYKHLWLPPLAPFDGSPPLDDFSSYP